MAACLHGHESQPEVVPFFRHEWEKVFFLQTFKCSSSSSSSSSSHKLNRDPNPNPDPDTLGENESLRCGGNDCAQLYSTIQFIEMYGEGEEDGEEEGEKEGEGNNTTDGRKVSMQLHGFKYGSRWDSWCRLEIRSPGGVGVGNSRSGSSTSALSDPACGSYNSPINSSINWNESNRSARQPIQLNRTHLNWNPDLIHWALIWNNWIGFRSSAPRFNSIICELFIITILSPTTKRIESWNRFYWILRWQTYAVQVFIIIIDIRADECHQPHRFIISVATVTRNAKEIQTHSQRMDSSAAGSKEIKKEKKRKERKKEITWRADLWDGGTRSDVDLRSGPIPTCSADRGRCDRPRSCRHSRCPRRQTESNSTRIVSTKSPKITVDPIITLPHWTLSALVSTVSTYPINSQLLKLTFSAAESSAGKSDAVN